MSDERPLSLDFLLGTFHGVETMYASAWAPGGSATSTSTGRPELDGRIVVQTYQQRRDDQVSFEMHVVWMVDPATGDVLYYGFDTAGFPPDPPARGSWDADTLTLVRETARGRSRLVVTTADDGWSWSRSFQATPDDEWSPVYDAEFRPAPPPTAG